jgi:hypothetical protein
LKKRLFILFSFTTVLIFKSFGQDTQQQNQLSQLLSQYYQLKDALIDGSKANASAAANMIIKTLNSIDYKIIAEGNINALLKDASFISETNDLEKQRVNFANLSANMVAVARSVKLTAQSIYLDYCPMRKATWLSNAKEIKNPFYGNAMPGCGKIVETIQY